MGKRHPGLLAAGIIAWTAYVTAVFAVGHSHWTTNVLGVLYLILWGRLLFLVWKRKSQSGQTGE